ncbi:DNA polymerase ligase-domain-containing protein [Hypoxylon sp. FL0543]|nr:DNA polymerase ligase-domain-containing protein [Hypoxylon sp. FL0543]
MATKRGPSPELVGNPFIKKRNLEWNLELSSTTRDGDDSSSSDEPNAPAPEENEGGPGASAVEAGKAKIEDHLGYFSGLLAKSTLSPFPPDVPRLSIESYRRLYETNSGSRKGAHFVVHQHDHPIAGTHYDLRLQINETSSASWAIMYGLPGDPNSQRLNRNATETRIHCLWNHLIETASASTGSLLIWDTGTYTILPPRESTGRAASNSQSEDEDSSPDLTEQEKLHQAFQRRKIRIRLNGTRLPHNYVLNLRLTKDEDIAGRVKSARAPTRRRRRGGPARGRGRGRGKGKAADLATSSDSDSDSNSDGDVADDEDSEIVNAPPEEADTDAGVSAVEREVRELEDEQVRRTNAYVGAANSVGSVHQRRWYLSLDREACGFAKRRRAGRVVWEPESELREGEAREKEKDGDGGGGGGGGDRLAFPFYVRGVEVERSVVTGRTGAEVLRDEGVEGYVRRKGWRPILN